MQGRNVAQSKRLKVLERELTLPRLQRWSSTLKKPIFGLDKGDNLKQPLIPDGSRSKQSENIYSAVHLGTGAEVCPFVIDWQDSDATIRWLEMAVEAHPGQLVLLWMDQARHHTGDQVQEWLEEHSKQIRVIHFPAYTPEENPQEPAWKALKKQVSQHRWYHAFADLSQAIDTSYQKGKRHVVNRLEKFGYYWKEGRIYPLPATT